MKHLLCSQINKELTIFDHETTFDPRWGRIASAASMFL